MSNRDSRLLMGPAVLGSLLFLSGALAQTPPAPQAPGASQPAVAGLSPQQPTSQQIRGNDSESAAALEIRNINRTMTILRAQLAELELRAKVAAKQKELSGSRGEQPSSPLSASVGAPSVVSVAGLKGQLEAVLVFPSGVSQRVKVGDIIGDQRVETVSRNEVVLSDLKGKNQRRLAFGSTAPVREAAPSALQAGTQFPPGMPVPGMR